MPMTQADIQSHYRNQWAKSGEKFAQGKEDALRYSSQVEDEAIYPAYEQLIRDHAIRVDGGRVLDVGCGSGRWVRFFLERFRPQSIVGVDFAEASAELLRSWATSVATGTELSFHAADITTVPLHLEGRFDLVNIGNVLFHIPEQDKFERALANAASLLNEGGRVVTTEYLPRTNMRTEWMMVRSRYEFESACRRAGLEIADIRASSFFSNDPLGIDGPDDGTRRLFHATRSMSQQFLANANEESRRHLVAFLALIEHSCLSFCRERMAEIDLPSQKLVVLRRG